MLKQFSRFFLIQTLIVLPGFSQSKLIGDFMPALTIRSGASYSIGKNENADVGPGLALGINFDLQKKIHPAVETGVNFRYDYTDQHIQSNSAYGNVSYKRVIQFLSVGGILQYSSVDKTFHSSFSFGFRSPVSGQMVRRDFYQQGKNLSKQELNLKPFRKFIPCIQLAGYYQIGTFRNTRFFAGAMAGFSLASTDFTYQSSTMNSVELCLKVSR